MRRSIHHYLSVWLGAAMLLVVLALAVMLTFTSMWEERMYGNKRIFFIFLLLAYAVYRSIRIYRYFKAANEPEA